MKYKDLTSNHKLERKGRSNIRATIKLINQYLQDSEEYFKQYESRLKEVYSLKRNVNQSMLMFDELESKYKDHISKLLSNFDTEDINIKSDDNKLKENIKETHKKIEQFDDCMYYVNSPYNFVIDYLDPLFESLNSLDKAIKDKSSIFKYSPKLMKEKTSILISAYDLHKETLNSIKENIGYFGSHVSPYSVMRLKYNYNNLQKLKIELENKYKFIVNNLPKKYLNY